LALIKSKKLNLKNVKHFVLDECDRMLEQLGKFFEPYVFLELYGRTNLSLELSGRVKDLLR
jgi:hypothetical protein